MTTYGTAKWQGGLKDGKGAISTKSGALSDYEPRSANGQVLDRGTWYPWVCAVTGKR